MTTNIQIIDGPKELKKVFYRYGGYLDAWTKEGYRRYQVRAAIRSLEKLSGSLEEVTFRIEMKDGIAFTGVTRPIVFSQLDGRPQNIVSGALRQAG